MKLLTLKQMSIRQSDIVFKQPPVGVFIVAVVMWTLVLACVTLIINGRIGSFHPPRLLAGFVGLFFLLFAWLATGSFRASLHPTNWIIRIRGNDVFIKYRSYVNWRLSDDDLQIIEIHRDEMESAHLHKERITSQDRSGHDQIEFRKSLEIVLKDRDTSELEKALADEVSRPGWGNDRHRSKVLDYPVSADAGVIRVTWRGQGYAVRPSINRALQELGHLVKIDDALKDSQDITSSSLKNLPRDKQEKKLAELAQVNRIAAIETARGLYGTSLADAVKLIDELVAKA